MSVVVAFKSVNEQGENTFEILSENINKWIADKAKGSKVETREMGVQYELQEEVKEEVKEEVAPGLPANLDTTEDAQMENMFKQPKPKSTRTKRAPKEKASLYEAGEEKIGRDGETIYVVKEDKNGKKKWQKKKEKTVKKEKKVEKKVEKPKSTKASKRKAPMEKAKLYEEGEEKVGQDGEMYVVKSNKNGVKRWQKKKVKTEKKSKKKTEKKTKTKKKTEKKSDKKTEETESTEEVSEEVKGDYTLHKKITKVIQRILVKKSGERWRTDTSGYHNNVIELKLKGGSEIDDESLKRFLNKRMSKYFPEVKYDGVTIVEDENLQSLSFTIEA